MANVDRPSGAIAVGTLSGSPVSGALKTYNVDAANATAIRKGDFVVLEDDGNVTVATAGAALLGVVAAVKVDRSVPATEHPGMLPASTAGKVMVYVGKDIIYEIQEDGNAPVTTVGSNADIVATAGSDTTGVSAHELDSSDLVANDTTPASAQLRVVGVVEREDNDVTAANKKFLVVINEHQMAPGVGI